MAIALSFLILALLVLWFIIGAKGKWWLKALVIVMSLHLCLSISSSLPDFAGWPSDSELPDKFLVHWLVVKEPDKRTKEKGSIFLWETNLSDEASVDEKEGWEILLFSLVTIDGSQPRVHRLPYSTEDHEQANDIISRIQNGETIVGTKKGEGAGEGNGEGDGEGSGDGEGEGQQGGEGSNEEGNGSGSFSLSDDVTFQQLPPPFLPPK